MDTDIYSQESRRKQYDLLRVQLELERSSFVQHWKTLNDFILPRRGRFYSSDVNRGDRRSQNIIDSTATFALKVLRSGMMSGITSPARPWFRLSTSDPGLAEFGPVKEWLYLVSARMATVFLRSNLYNVLPILYGDMGCFGTACMYAEEDFDKVIRFYSFPIGSYSLAQNDKLQVDVLHREQKMTVRQVIKKFAVQPNGRDIDWSKVSLFVKSSWEQGHTEAWVDVCHVVMPNEKYDKSKLEAKYNSPFGSCYYEKGASPQLGTGYRIDDDRLLRESGYDYFPGLAPRWEVTGEDTYATSCPGMDSLGDIRQLQTGEKWAAKAIEKMVNPPMVGPSSLKTQRTSIVPGDVTYEDIREGMKGFRPVHEVNPRVQELEFKQQAVRERIRQAFYSNIFLQITEMERTQVTATEIEERKAEKLVVLGPVLEQLNQDVLDPLIDIAFNFMQKRGMIPTPPQELQGENLKIDYLSIMAQAQKLAGVENHERFMARTAEMAAVFPQIVDKVDLDQHIDVYSEMLSITPGVVRSDDKVAAMRDARAKEERVQQQALMAKDAAVAAKNLATSPTDEKNALTDLLGNIPALSGGVQ